MIETLKEWALTYENELYFRGFLERYIKWLSNVKLDSEKQVLTKLLLKMNFYSKIDIKDHLSKKVIQYKNSYSNFENTQFLPMTSTDRRYNGAYEIIGQLIEVDKEIGYDSEPLFPYKQTVIMDSTYILEDTDTLIILDDICGTGRTLRKFIELNKTYWLEKKVIILFLVITPNAQITINEIIKENPELDLTVDHCMMAQKLSDCGYLTDEEFKILESIEASLWSPSNNNILGYKRSQLLIGFTHNIPNNTISSIWYTDNLGVRKRWNPLFIRYTKKTKPKRKAQNYNVAKRNK